MPTGGNDTPTETPRRTGLMPPWQPGQSGNPAGRPKSARSKLSESFLEALLKDFEQASDEGDPVGAKAIAVMRSAKPNEYARMIASILAKEFDANVSGDLPPELMRWLGLSS